MSKLVNHHIKKKTEKFFRECYLLQPSLADRVTRSLTSQAKRNKIDSSFTIQHILILYIHGFIQ